MDIINYVIMLEFVNSNLYLLSHNICRLMHMCVLVLPTLKCNYRIKIMNRLLRKNLICSLCNSINDRFVSVWSGRWCLFTLTHTLNTHIHTHSEKGHTKAVTPVVQSAVHHRAQHSSSSSLRFELSTVHWTSSCLPIGIRRETEKITTKLWFIKKN